jgi:uncharacterized protein YbjT (DUF2867 family)
MSLAKSSESPHPQRDAMIRITGATGNIGRRVAELLSKRGETLRLMGRRVESMPELAQSERVIGDYANPASLDKAFEGVNRAFIVSGYAEPGRRAELHRNAFQAASRAGGPSPRLSVIPGGIAAVEVPHVTRPLLE